MSFLDFPAWILGDFARVEEFRLALKTITVVGPSPDHKHDVPLHSRVTERTGHSVVIEFIGGKTNVDTSSSAAAPPPRGLAIPSAAA